MLIKKTPRYKCCSDYKCFEYKDYWSWKQAPNTISLVTKAVLNTKFSQVENKTPGNSKYITVDEFNTLTG